MNLTYSLLSYTILHYMFTKIDIVCLEAQYIQPVFSSTDCIPMSKFTLLVKNKCVFLEPHFVQWLHDQSILPLKGN